MGQKIQNNQNNNEKNTSKCHIKWSDKLVEFSSGVDK